MLVIAPILPVHSVQNTCRDPRHPALYADWVSSCDELGLVSKLVSIVTAKEIDVDQSDADFVGPQLWWSGIQGGLWDGNGLDNKYRLSQPLIAPAVIDGDWVVGVGGSNLWVKSTITQKTIAISAQPKPWALPAVTGQRVAWINDDGHGGADIWTWSESNGIETLASEEAWEHSVVSWPEHWAWLEPERIVIHNIETGIQSEIQTRVVDGLTVWEDGVCWSAMGPKDLDIFCSDGLKLDRKGDQHWPYRSNSALIFRENNRVMLWNFEKDK